MSYGYGEHGHEDQPERQLPPSSPPAPAPGSVPLPYAGHPAQPYPPQYPAIPSPYKDVTAAYLLWFFLAGFGAHAFYLRQPVKAVTMLLLSLVGWATVVILIGFLPLAAVTVVWIVDAFLIPGRVRSLNLRIAATNAAAHAQLGQRPY